MRSNTLDELGRAVLETIARRQRATLEALYSEFDAPQVRSAFSFLRYWGEATTAEIIDATYSETPAGYETADRWWAECVEDRLVIANASGCRSDPNSLARRSPTVERSRTRL